MTGNVFILEQFELDAMKRIIAEEPTVEDALNQQYKYSKVNDREFTGHGFFTHLEVADKSLRLTGSPDLWLGISVRAKFDSSRFGVGFVLFVTKGLIDTLECYTYDDSWPEDILTYEFV